MRASIFLLLTGIITLLSGNAMAFEKKTIYGYVEKATLVDKKLTVSAKLDTGAKSSSLSAINIEPVTIQGIEYLRFVVPTKQGDVVFLSEYLGKVRIKARSEEHHLLPQAKKIKRRPVVLMRIQLGNEVRKVPVNLTNRKRFLYPLLLGRSAITAFSGLVDPSIVFTLKSNNVEKNEVK